MMDTVLTLVFSIVMLFFMIFPAIKIVGWIDTKLQIPLRWYNTAVILVTIVLSFIVGLFLRFY